MEVHTLNKHNHNQNDRLFYPFLTYGNTNITDKGIYCSACAGVMANWQEEVNIAGTVLSTESGSPNAPPCTHICLMHLKSPARFPATIYKRSEQLQSK